MIIKFSRHASRRLKLYDIPEEILRDIIIESEIDEGYNEIIKTITGFRFPIKIAFAYENDILTVITAYPLKKGR